jgi:hypothetical protein
MLGTAPLGKHARFGRPLWPSNYAPLDGGAALHQVINRAVAAKILAAFAP